jgi:hypothetical protein
VLNLNQAAARRLADVHSLQVVPGATYLFAEPGVLEPVVQVSIILRSRRKLPESTSLSRFVESGAVFRDGTPKRRLAPLIQFVSPRQTEVCHDCLG